MKFEFPPTLTEFAQDMDLDIHWYHPDPDEGLPPTVALCTWHEPSVGIFGGPITPFFASEAELEAFCRKVADGTIAEGELAEECSRLSDYLTKCADDRLEPLPSEQSPAPPIRDTSTAIVGIGDADKGGWFVWLVEFRGGNGDFKDGFGSYEAALEYARATYPNLEIFQRVFTPYDQEVEK